MSPRPYDLGRRRDQIDQTRRRILDAARAVLADPAGAAGFTVDAVARRADVARATVYYQFESKTGLLEALCDDLADAGGLGSDGLAAAFSQPDPWRAMNGFVGAFARFWDADRAVMRRLRAMAALDPEVASVIAARDERRRKGLGVLAGRLGAGGARVLATLMMLTSFETFDALSREGQAFSKVVPVVMSLMTQAVSPRSPGSSQVG